MIAASAVAAVAASASRSTELSHRLDPGERLVVKNVDGDVDVVAWERGDVRVEARIEVRAERQEDADRYLEKVEISISDEGDHVVLRADLPDRQRRSRWWSERRRPEGRIDYTVRVPRNADLQVHTVNGDVRVGELSGSLTACSTNGEIELRELGGAIDASSVNGDIVARFRSGGPGADSALHTVNGDVTLKGSQGLRASVLATSTNGSVTSDVASAGWERRGSSRLDGMLNGGGHALRLSSTNGSVRLRDD